MFAQPVPNGRLDVARRIILINRRWVGGGVGGGGGGVGGLQRRLGRWYIPTCVKYDEIFTASKQIHANKMQFHPKTTGSNQRFEFSVLPLCPHRGRAQP